MIKEYYKLIKPGIIKGNLLTTSAGFLLASKGEVNFVLLALSLSSTALIIASGCVFNNIIDKDIDSKMSRTKNRATVSGKISSRSAGIFGFVLGLVGFYLIAVYINWVTFFVGLLGFVVYVFVYAWGKRHSSYGTLIGSVAGSTPPVAGYCAVSGQIDAAAIVLFVLLTFWQMAHFYSIGIFRLDEYKKAGLPILPASKGVDETKKQIVIYVVLFILAVPFLTLFGYTGYLYLIVVSLVGLVWLMKGLRTYKNQADEKWAKAMFGYSLLVLLMMSLIISIDSFLP